MTRSLLLPVDPQAQTVLGGTPTEDDDDVSGADAEAFSEPLDHVGALYFTLTTLTTVGFGDIAARSDGARIVVMVQMVTNVLILGVVARLFMARARSRLST